jgi:hypothetical protein
VNIHVRYTPHIHFFFVCDVQEAYSVRYHPEKRTCLVFQLMQPNLARVYVRHFQHCSERACLCVLNVCVCVCVCVCVVRYTHMHHCQGARENTRSKSEGRGKQVHASHSLALSPSLPSPLSLFPRSRDILTKNTHKSPTLQALHTPIMCVARIYCRIPFRKYAREGSQVRGRGVHSKRCR